MSTHDATWYYDQMRTTDEFTVTQDHLALSRRAHISWHWAERAGAPGLDLKRPYGNSDWHEDVAEAVDGEFLNALGPGARDDYIEANAERWERLHAEMTVVLQIILDTRSFEAGRYRRQPVGGWVRA